MRLGNAGSAPGRGKAAAVVLTAFAVLATVPILLGLVVFDSRPGDSLAAPVKWPQSSAIGRSASEPQLLVFVHPFCACTAATIAELETLKTRPAMTFVVVRPGGNAGWTWKELPGIRRELPMAKVIWDEGAAEAARFHASTSGTALLYGTAGELLFQGGVTESRGHQGENYGLDQLAGALRDASASTTRAKRFSVFGCALTSRPGRLL